MNSISRKLLLAGLLVLASMSVASARPGGAFGGHGGSFGGHGGSVSGGHYQGHGGPGWNGGAWHGGGWHHGGWYGGDWVGGAYLGLWPYFDAPYYGYGTPGVYGDDYYPDTVVTPQQPPVYMQQNNATAPVQPAQTGDWYYCSNPAGYYPYIKNCSGNWQRVPAKPPGMQ